VRDIETGADQIVVTAGSRQGLSEVLDRFRQRLGQTETKV